MNIKVIKSETEYSRALTRANAISNAKPGTKEGVELELLLLAIKDYEDKHHTVAFPASKYFGALKRGLDGMKYQNQVRNEWA